VSGIGRVKGLLAEVANFLGALIMHDPGSQQPETGVISAWTFCGGKASMIS